MHRRFFQRMKRMRSVRWAATIAGVVPALFGSGFAVAECNCEDDVRAAMIYNFARFTRWPARAFENTDKHFNICASTGAPMMMALKALENKTLDRKQISITGIKTAPTQNQHCHVVVVTPDIAFDIENQGSASITPHTLYVAVDRGIASGISSIELVTVGRQTRFYVNLSAAQASNIEISSKLIDLAIGVK